MPWLCFVIEPTDRARVYLRRFSWKQRGTVECPGHFPYHNADLHLLDEVSEHPSPWPKSSEKMADEGQYAGRFPTACACGYVFDEQDERELVHARLFRAADGREFTLDQAPPGSMWNATWWPYFRHAEAPADGWNPTVKLPDGIEWHIDGCPNNGGRWTRSGKPPTLTVEPSIKAVRYHGYLRGGVLTEDVEGHKFGPWAPPS